MFRRARKTLSDGSGFDDDEWRLLRRGVEAASRFDLEAFAEHLRTSDQAFPSSERAAAYLWFALRYQVLVRLQRRPTSTDLSELAAESFPWFTELVRSDEKLLSDLLHVVFEFGDFAPGLLPLPKFRINGAAALAVLLVDPATPDELDAIRARIEPWYDKNKETFAALAPREDG